MSPLGALALLGTLGFAQAGSTATLAAQALSKSGHWEKKPSALLSFDSDGALSSEIHLGDSDDANGARTKEATGGVGADGRLAWSFEKTFSWNAARTRIAATRRRLRLFGSDGKLLWESADADVPPEGGAPLLLSRDGEVALVAERAAQGWRVVARAYIGSTLMEAGPFPELQETALTPDGRFAMARWTVPDQSAAHTFLDVVRKLRKDVPSSSFALGRARLAGDGKVYSGRKLAFDLAAEPAEKK